MAAGRFVVHAGELADIADVIRARDLLGSELRVPVEIDSAQYRLASRRAVLSAGSETTRLSATGGADSQRYSLRWTSVSESVPSPSTSAPTATTDPP